MPTLKDKSGVCPPAIVQCAEAAGPTEMTADELHTLLDSADTAAALVIDVRPADEFNKVNIQGSVNKPFQELNYTQLVAEVNSKARPDSFVLVFVSAQSPDVDDLAAREYLKEFEKVHGHPPAEGKVCVLLGGVCNWVERQSV